MYTFKLNEGVDHEEDDENCNTLSGCDVER